MASLKFVLLSKKPIQPLFCRFYHCGKTVYVNQGILIHSVHWCQETEDVYPSHPSFSFVSDFIKKSKKKMFSRYYEKLGSSFNQNNNLLFNFVKTGAEQDFFYFTSDFLQKSKGSMKKNTYFSQLSVFNSFFNFCQKKQLFYSDFSFSLFSNYLDSLSFSCKYSSNSICLFFSILKKFVSLFCAHFDYDFNPRFFSQIKLPSKTSKVFFLSEKNVQDLVSSFLSLSDSQRISLDLFLFSFYAGGLRFSDVLNVRFNCFADNLFSYTSIKSGVQVNIFLPSEALSIVSKYNRSGVSPEAFLFPFFDNFKLSTSSDDFYNQMAAFNSQVNRDLLVIGKKINLSFPLTFHIARHSFATFALSKGLDIYKVSKILGHRSVKTTERYIHLRSVSYSDIFK